MWRLLGLGALVVAIVVVAAPRLTRQNAPAVDRRPLRQTNAALRQQLEETTTRLTEELTRGREELARAQAELATAAAELTRLRNAPPPEPSPEKPSREALQLQRTIQDRDQELRGVKQALADTERARGELKQQVAQMAPSAKRLERLQQDHDKLQARFAETEKRLNEGERELTRLKRELTKAQAESAKRERALEDAQRDHERQLERLRREVAEAKAARQEAQGQSREVERLKRELAEANDRIAELIVALDAQEQLSSDLLTLPPVGDPSDRRSPNAPPTAGPTGGGVSAKESR